MTPRWAAPATVVALRVSRAKEATFPPEAQHPREGVDVGCGHLQDGRELGLDDEQARVGRSWVGVAGSPVGQRSPSPEDSSIEVR